MDNIWDVYEFLLFAAGAPEKGVIDPLQAGLALNAGQDALFRFYYTVKGDTGVEALAPFHRTAPLLTSNTGAAPLPLDHAGSRMFVSKGVTYTPVGWMEDTNTISKSQLHPIAEYARYDVLNGDLQVYPEIRTSGILFYYAKPKQPVIGFTMSGDDPVYDATTSVQLEFAKRFWMEVIYRSLPTLGVNLSYEGLIGLSKEFERV